MSQNEAKADDPPRPSSPQSEADRLAALKQLLFGSEKAELAELRKQLEESNVNSDKVSELLPKAVWKAASRDDELSDALGPLIGTAFRSAIKNDADSIAEAISPIMGPAIRSSIQQSIRGMVQSMNKTLEYSVSLKGLKLRWEALTTGKSFAELVLLHTLRYRVVQVFLIDRETGLLIKHAAMDESAENVDLASGMLTAIQDFVRDSFGASEDDSLVNMSFGNQTVWIETGAHAFLAAVIEGEAPASLRTDMQETVEQIHVRFAEELDSYQGDSTPFVAAQPILDGCLVSAFEEDEEEGEPAEEIQVEKTQRSPWQKAAIGAGIAAAILGIFWINNWFSYRNRIKDIRRQLAVPTAVEVAIDDGKLVCSGEARQSWMAEAESLALRMPGIESVSMDEVTDLDQPWRQYLAKLKKEAGLVVTRTAANDGQYELSGLRDPLASDPAALLVKFDISPECIEDEWKPFQSLEPELVRRRIVNALQTKQKNISAQLDGTTLRFTGRATSKWVEAARRRAESLAANSIELDFEKVTAPDPPVPDPTPLPDEIISAAELQRTIDRFAPNRRFILFDPGSSQLTTTAKASLPPCVAGLLEIIEAGKKAGSKISITLVGTAARGDGAAAVELSKQRAREVWKVMQKLDLPAANVLLQGVGTGRLKSAPPGFSEEMSRRCCLIRITVTPATQKP